MQHSPATDSATDRTGATPPGVVPKARTGPAARDPVGLPGTIEDQVARLADFVLKVCALADRYETALRHIAPSTPAFADQQARVRTLRAAAESGRNRLITLGR